MLLELNYVDPINSIAENAYRVKLSFVNGILSIIISGIQQQCCFENSRYGTEGEDEINSAQRHPADLSRKRESLL
jgi:hypothetical protein